MSDVKYDFNNLKKPDFDDLASEIQTKASVQFGKPYSQTPAKITIGKEAKRSGGVLSKPVTFEYENGTVITVNIAADGLIANVMIGKNVIPIQKSELRDVGKLATKVGSAILHSEGQKGKVAAALGASGASDKKKSDPASTGGGVDDAMKKGKVVNKSNAKALLDDQIEQFSNINRDKKKTVQEKKNALYRLQNQSSTEQEPQIKDLDSQIKIEGTRWSDLTQQLKELKKAGGITESAKNEDDDDSDTDDSGDDSSEKESKDTEDDESGNESEDDPVMESNRIKQPYTMTPRQDRMSRIKSGGAN